MIKPRKNLEEIIPYSIDKYRQNWRLKLDSNENIYGPSTNILNAIRNFDLQDISLYPAYGKFIDKLAVKFEISKDNILLTNGCDEALSVIISSYLDKDDEILSFFPTFSMPALYAKLAQGNVKTIDYDERFVFDVNKLQKNIEKNTKIVYIATPNNPTGELVKTVEIKTLLQDNPDVLFIVDCTYINFSYEATFEDYVDITKNYDNIIVVKSFSKDFAIAGLRLGVAIGDKDIISNLKKTTSPYNVNAIVINCGMASLNDNKNFEEIKELNKIARNFLYDGLKERGFEPYRSEANFILCDFGPYCDFYYQKLKNNGVIVRNYSKNSPISTCLRITVPKIGGIKYIFELLNKKDVLILDLDGIVFDVTDSYLKAIQKTFKYFSKLDIDIEEIHNFKNTSNIDCNWNTTKNLLTKYGFDIKLKDIISVFQDFLYNSKVEKDNYLIDNEKLLIAKEIFEELSKKYDFVYFSGRLREEARYSLKKFDIEKYFHYSITSDDLPKNMLKPHPRGVLNILEHCPNLSIKFFGDSVDDIIAGNGANIETIGVISPYANFNIMANNFKHLGVKYILSDIKNLENFLGEIEKDYAKNC